MLFHDIIEMAVVRAAVVVDLHGAGVVKARGRGHLALEPRGECGVAGTLGPDKLNRARPLEQPVLGEKDIAHPAAAEPPDQEVVTDFAGRRSLAPVGVDPCRIEYGEAAGRDQEHQRL